LKVFDTLKKCSLKKEKATTNVISSIATVFVKMLSNEF